MNPLLESFVQESRENLQEGAQALLKLEKQPQDAEIINEVFRSIHTIKGSSGLFDIHPLGSLVHALEDLFDALRNGIGVVSSEVIDLALDSLDQVGSWLDSLEKTELLPSDAEATAQSFIANIRQLNSADSNIAVAEPAPEKTAAPLPAMVETIAHEDRKKWWLAKQSIYWLEYKPDPQCFFNGEDPLRTIQLLPGLYDWQSAHSLSAFNESYDPFVCALSFEAISTATESELREHLKYVAEQITILEVQPEQLLFCHGSDIEHDALQAVKEQLTSDTELSKLVQPLHSVLNPDSKAWQAVDWFIDLGDDALELLQEMLAIDVSTAAHKKPLEKASSEAPQDSNEKSSASNKSLEVPVDVAKAVWQTQIELLESVADDQLIAGAIASVANVLRSSVGLVAPSQVAELDEAIAQAKAKVSVEALIQFIVSALSNNELDVLPTVEPQETLATALPASSVAADKANESDSKGNTMLRVDQRKIDQLMDLAGELIVAKNALPFIAENAEKQHGNRQISKEIKAQYQVLDRLVSAMQEGIMSVRMVPVSSVFQRFPRLVRDIGRKINKQIDLTLIGESTEADKNVIESLVDPLVHMIRNSVDHGIEAADERVAKGKPAVGKLILSATPQEDQVLIQLQDDGKGIDPAVIKQKALDKGVIDQETFERLTDKEAQQLIFAAGFSSRDTASDLSGRGVGMDVVKNAVESAGGTVELSSTVDVGTTISLHLPLSVAVSRVMRIEVSGQQYGIPMDIINETVRIPVDRVQTVRNRRTIVLRDTLVPIKSLADLLAIDTIPERDEVSLLIVSTHRGVLGLEVDDFLGDLEIIQKPMVGFMREFTAYSGATMLGDGSVLLVLNLEDLL
ncbi:chemotaxis protein CheA [Salinibius halmophilus]|uniref:chemotaxis protein CheA n=1 Tax=Salinibius halmophilus TaxID=1853216 RepID=UPI000E66A1A9|nr:chemotaxis protein CheA [Salinibius halmophilus]